MFWKVQPIRPVSALMIAASAFLAITPAQAGSDVVFIDYSDPAYTVYAGMPAERAEEVKRKMVGKPVEALPFDEFSTNREKFISQKIVKDEHPNGRAVEGIVELVRKYPNTPFGLTWNGGIAFTRNDYQFAKSRFELFGKDQEEYLRTMPKLDPVDPKNHLKPLLGW